MEKGQEWFRKYGTKAIFWGRMLPVVRTFVSLAAGVEEMNLYKFSMVTFLGSLPWNAAWAVIGYKAGENWRVLGGYFKKLDLFIVILIAVFVAWYILRHLKNKYS
jgi:membrane protein DedA with SNARE-associated domain